jgi:predicted amino acid dehydrogenase
MKTLKLILHALCDGILPYLPQYRKRSGYAFLIHPRDLQDVYKKYPFFRFFSQSAAEWILRHFWPITVSHISGAKRLDTQADVAGWIISIPLTANLMTKNKDLAKRMIIRAARLAQKKGAKIIGLGAMTASYSRGGLDIREHVDISVNTGRLYTSHIVTETALKAMTSVELAKDKVTFGIVGAAGSIGTGCYRLLLHHGIKKFVLIDIDSKIKKVQELSKDIDPKHQATIVATSDLNRLRECDVIIAATNHPEALIKSAHLKPGAIVIDDAQPSDIAEEVYQTRDDVLALEGGVVHARQIDTHFPLGLRGKNEIFSCLAETILLAAIGHTDDFQLGTMTNLEMTELEKLISSASVLGFGVGSFQSDYRLYTDEDIARVRDIIKKTS